MLKKRGFDMTPPGNRKNFMPAHDTTTGHAIHITDEYMDRLWRGTTSIEAADNEGWVVSVTPSGGWIPACIAGNTGYRYEPAHAKFCFGPNTQSI